MAFKMKYKGFPKTQGDSKKVTEATADPKTGNQVAKNDYISGSVETQNGKKIITFEDGSKGDMSKYYRGNKTLLEHLEEGTL